MRRALNKRYSCCRWIQGSVGGTGTCSPSWMAWFYTVHWQASVCKCGPWMGALRKVTFSTAPASCPLSKGLISPNVPLCECMPKSKCQGNWGGVSESYSLTEQQACPATPMFLFQNAIFSPGHVHLIVITLWPDTLFYGDGLGLFSSGLERYYPQLNRRLNIWLTVSLNQLNYSF